MSQNKVKTSRVKSSVFASLLVITLLLLHLIVMAVPSFHIFENSSLFISPSSFFIYIENKLNSNFSKTMGTIGGEKNADKLSSQYVNISVSIEDITYWFSEPDKGIENIVADVYISVEYVNKYKTEIKNSSKIQLTIYPLRKENKNYYYYFRYYSLPLYADLFSQIMFVINVSADKNNITIIKIIIHSISEIKFNNIIINNKKIKELKDHTILKLKLKNNISMSDIVIVYRKNKQINKRVYENVFNPNLIFETVNYTNIYIIYANFYKFYNGSLSRNKTLLLLLDYLSLFTLVPYLLLLYKIILGKDSINEFLGYISVSMVFVLSIFSFSKYVDDIYGLNYYNIYLFLFRYVLYEIGGFVVIYMTYVITTRIRLDKYHSSTVYVIYNILIPIAYLTILFIAILARYILEIDVIWFSHFVFGEFEWPAFRLTYDIMFLIIILGRFFYKIIKSDP